MADTLEIFGSEFTNVTGIKATDDQSGTKVYIRPQGTKSISANGTGIDVAEYASVDVSVSAPSPSLQSKTYNVSSGGTATVTADSGYDGLSSVQVSVPQADPFLPFSAEFYTDSGARKWRARAEAVVYNDDGYFEGYIEQGSYYGDWEVYNVVPSNTTVTPTESAQTIGGANYMMEGAVTVAGDADLIPGNIKKDVNIFGVTGTYEGGGGGSSMQIGNLEVYGTSSSISCTGLQGEPTAFSIMVDTSVATGTPSKIVAVVFDGTSLHAQTITNTTNAQVTYDSTSLSKTYSNGTLTITSNGPSFVDDVYYGVYVYDGGAVETKDVQVGSGATSITFTGLEDEPAWWSCIFKSNFGTSSGYQRVIYVAKGNTTTNVSGMEMDSGAHNAAHWTASYNNGSFTITSQGTNAGGYFHQPGYYQLTYAYDDGSGGNYQSKTVTPTTSQQVVQADSGYDALKKVTVNAMPSMTLPTATSATSSGTSKATITPTSSTQYLNIPTGYNDTAQYYTISATSGGSVTVKTTTMSNTSATATQIQFTSLTGQPKAFFCRCTSNLSRNSSNRYYYIADIRWDGSSSGGVVGNKYYVYNGQYSNQTTGYSYTYSSGTLTLSTTGSQSASPGSFYNGTYELVYVY